MDAVLSPSPVFTSLKFDRVSVSTCECKGTEHTKQRKDIIWKRKAFSPTKLYLFVSVGLREYSD